jgi:hypothetical protein
MGPARGGALASELFSHHLAQDVLIEREVRRHETLQARVFIAQLPQLADLGEPELAASTAETISRYPSLRLLAMSGQLCA